MNLRQLKRLTFRGGVAAAVIVPPIPIDEVLLKTLLLTGVDYSTKGMREQPNKVLAPGNTPPGCTLVGSLLYFPVGTTNLSRWDLRNYTMYINGADRIVTARDCWLASADKTAVQMLNGSSFDGQYCKFDGGLPTGAFVAHVYCQSGATNLILKHNEFANSDTDCLKPAGVSVIEDNWFHDCGVGPNPANHYDFIQGTVGAGTFITSLSIKRNLFDARTFGYGKTNVVRLATGGADYSNIAIEDNVMIWTDTPSSPLATHISSPGGSIQNVSIRGNWIRRSAATALFPGVAAPTGYAIWDGNKDFDTLLTIPIPSGSGFTAS